MTRPPFPVVDRLRAAGCVFAEEEAALLRDAAGSRTELERLVAARVTGVPLEVLLGWAELDGLRVAVVPGVFVPRRRTELLARRAAELASGSGRRPLVVDLCCGSGAIGAVVASRVPDAEVHAADIDPDAVTCARRNLPPGRVHEGDLYAALPPDLAGRVDVIACNAPYVPSEKIATMPPEAREHEHRVALDGGADGLDLHRRVTADALAWLAPGGHLLVETSLAQASRTADLARTAGLVPHVEVDEDVAGCVVVATAR